MGDGAEACPGNGVCCNRLLSDRQLFPCKIDWAVEKDVLDGGG